MFATAAELCLGHRLCARRLANHAFTHRTCCGELVTDPNRGPVKWRSTNELKREERHHMIREKTIRQRILAAADYIDRHGWTTGRLYHDTGRVCILGAVNMITPRTRRYLIGDYGWQQDHSIIRYIAGHLVRDDSLLEAGGAPTAPSRTSTTPSSFRARTRLSATSAASVAGLPILSPRRRFPSQSGSGQQLAGTNTQRYGQARQGRQAGPWWTPETTRSAAKPTGTSPKCL